MHVICTAVLILERKDSQLEALINQKSKPRSLKHTVCYLIVSMVLGHLANQLLVGATEAINISSQPHFHRHKSFPAPIMNETLFQVKPSYLNLAGQCLDSTSQKM